MQISWLSKPKLLVVTSVRDNESEEITKMSILYKYKYNQIHLKR